MSLAVVLGIALLVLYWAWIFLFFGRIRPRIMEALGRSLGVRVRESANPLTAGTYEGRSDRTPHARSRSATREIAGPVGNEFVEFTRRALVGVC